MRVLMATEGPAVDAAMLAGRPQGGSETAFALLAAAFARAGHGVTALAAGPCPPPGAVAWRPLGAGAGEGTFDLVLASRLPRLLARLPRPRAGRALLWLHNPGPYLAKPRHLLPLLRARPVAVTLGPHHAATLPRWLPLGGRAQVPLALAPPFDRAFLGTSPRPPPPPVAVFASNPLRGLDWLLDLWAAWIRPGAPGAELHLYSGAATYGGDPRLAERAAPVLERAAALREAGVRLLPPVPRAGLAAAYAGARVMLYRGDPGETFCLALAEAQAAGLPCVVTASGAVTERLAPGRTGLVARDAAAFAAGAIRLLTDDAAWTAMHAAALARGPGPDWDAVAARMAALAS